MKNILLCTLGASWPVIPEVFGFVAPERVDLYAHHPERARLGDLQKKHGIATPDELWICTSEGEPTQKSIAAVKAWWTALGAPLPLRLWTAAGTDQLATQAECDHIRELTLRVALLAAEHCAGGQLVLSLAGGRKTMSADLQWAGTLFGAQALLHFITRDLKKGTAAFDTLIDRPDIATFTQALPAELATAVTPLVVGAHHRDDLLDVALDGQTVTSARFPLALAAPDCAWPMPADGATLTADIQHRQREGSRLFGNFIAQLAADEKHENWRSLYRLPPARIDALRQTRLTPADRDWLVSLPKADLHRHLGGSLSLADQIKVGHAVWQALNDTERQSALLGIAPLLASAEWPWDWPHNLQKNLANATLAHHRAATSAALLVHATIGQLQYNLYTVTEPRVALKQLHSKGFAAYERPGELTGSATLGHPAALAPYATALVQQARNEGLAYLELRGSPHKYRPHDPAAFVRDLATALANAGASVVAPTNTSTADEQLAPIIRFIWILDRRQPDPLSAVVQQAVAARAQSHGFLVGLDLAGDEAIHAPENLAPHFTAAFRECLPITIHAGEGESADNIWQAAYHLHADRIGHGLTLADHPNLATRFRDRDICLELCPSSNVEVALCRLMAVPAEVPAFGFWV